MTEGGHQPFGSSWLSAQLSEHGEFKGLNLNEVASGFPDSQPLSTLTEFWRSRRPADGVLPARRDFPVEDLREWIGHVSLAEVHENPRRFRWRLIGSSIVKFMGRDTTGMWFDELYEGPMLEGYLRNYSLAVDRREPVFFKGDLEFVGKDFVHFRMVQLPLAADGRNVDMLLLCLDFSKY